MDVFFLYTRPPGFVPIVVLFTVEKRSLGPNLLHFQQEEEEGGSDPLYKTCIPQYTLARVAFGLMSTAENETSTNSGSVPRRRSFLSFTRNILYYSKYIFNARSPLTGTISSATSMPPVFSQFSYIILPILFPIL